jgi:hypothetical protein
MDTDETSRRPGTTRLVLAIEGAPDSDLEELARLGSQLRRQLLEMDVDDVELVREGEAPAGAKAADPAAIGALAVTLAPAAIQGVIGLVRGWARHRPVSSIKVTLGHDSLELTNASPEQLDQLTRAFIARHST